MHLQGRLEGRAVYRYRSAAAWGRVPSTHPPIRQSIHPDFENQLLLKILVGFWPFNRVAGLLVKLKATNRDFGR